VRGGEIGSGEEVDECPGEVEAKEIGEYDCSRGKHGRAVAGKKLEGAAWLSLWSIRRILPYATLLSVCFQPDGSRAYRGHPACAAQTRLYHRTIPLRQHSLHHLLHSIRCSCVVLH
jgi:hypothetical protein